jgi:acetyl esterase/lipase
MSFGKSRNGSVPCRELLRMSGIAIVVSFSAVLAQAQAQPLEALLSQAHQTYADGVIGLQDVVFAQIPDFHPLRADLYVPTRSRGADPVVIWVHGGGWGVGGPREGDGGPYGSWPQVLAKLAARGHVVMAINYRFTGEARFPAQIQDVKAAVRWIRSNATQYGADPTQVILWGQSAGGYQVALAGTACNQAALEPAPQVAGPPMPGMTIVHVDPKQSSCVQGIVDWFGPIEFARMDAQSPPNAVMKHDLASGPESKLLGCALPTCPPALLEQANPLTYVRADTPPFLIMQGTADRGVPIQQSETLYQALRAQGVAARLIEVSGADHMFGGASPRVIGQLIDRVFAWIDHPGGSGEETIAQDTGAAIVKP